MHRSRLSTLSSARRPDRPRSVDHLTRDWLGDQRAGLGGDPSSSLRGGLSERAIADGVGVARGTVRRALAAGTLPTFSRPPAPWAFDAFEARARVLLAEFPSMPATVIAERLGWDGSPSWLQKKVALLRPEYAPKDPADRLEHLPGDQAQCDMWFPPVPIPRGSGQVGSPPVLVIVASFSRFVTAAMLPTRTTPDLGAGMWLLLSEQLGAVPKRCCGTTRPASAVVVACLTVSPGFAGPWRPG